MPSVVRPAPPQSIPIHPKVCQPQPSGPEPAPPSAPSGDRPQPSSRQIPSTAVRARRGLFGQQPVNLADLLRRMEVCQAKHTMLQIPVRRAAFRQIKTANAGTHHHAIALWRPRKNQMTLNRHGYVRPKRKWWEPGRKFPYVRPAGLLHGPAGFAPDWKPARCR